MLALQLNELEKDGVINKTIFPVIPPKTEYTLTEFGKSLAPVIESMEAWGNHYNQVIGKNNQSNIDDCRQAVDFSQNQ